MSNFAFDMLVPTAQALPVVNISSVCWSPLASLVETIQALNHVPPAEAFACPDNLTATAFSDWTSNSSANIEWNLSANATIRVIEASMGYRMASCIDCAFDWISPIHPPNATTNVTATVANIPPGRYVLQFVAIVQVINARYTIGSSFQIYMAQGNTLVQSSSGSSNTMVSQVPTTLAPSENTAGPSRAVLDALIVSGCVVAALILFFIAYRCKKRRKQNVAETPIPAQPAFPLPWQTQSLGATASAIRTNSVLNRSSRGFAHSTVSEPSTEPWREDTIMVYGYNSRIPLDEYFSSPSQSSIATYDDPRAPRLDNDGSSSIFSAGDSNADFGDSRSTFGSTSSDISTHSMQYYGAPVVPGKRPGSTTTVAAAL